MCQLLQFHNSNESNLTVSDFILLQSLTKLHLLWCFGILFQDYCDGGTLADKIIEARNVNTNKIDLFATS